MPWLAVDGDNGEEWIYETRPDRGKHRWTDGTEAVRLPNGSIKKLIGKELTWNDEPYELKK